MSGLSPATIRRAQRGIGMLEVLIALLILVIGVLGFAGLQLVALKNTGEASHRAHATLIAQDAIERFQSNPGQLPFYLSEDNWPSDIAEPGGAPTDWKGCMSSACSAAEMAAWDIDQLAWVATNTLPAGLVLAKRCDFNDMECVIVSWDGQDAAGCVTDDGVNEDVESSCLVMEVAQ
ncbi:type IV pilus modification protein PilV [Halopseudomonas sp.]|uniref:type IV pilus modification protein PilV n=1 Tax=Halopseudomonas sp. TaxID=2901191 RepID=UPI00300139FE